jgi:predicted ATPase
LSEDETYQVALAILHCSELGPELKQLLWDRTSGRPLFIEALLRKLLQEGYLEQSQGYAELKPDADLEALPDDVRELVISRLDSFTPNQQMVLRAAAVAGEDFMLEMLRELSEIADPAALRAIVVELSRAQVLEKVDDTLYRFRHGLTQRVIYESLSRAQRLRLHRMAVKFWREHPEVPYQPMVLAYHLMKCGLLPEAIEVVSSAAEAAENAGDIERALELYTHALTIFPDEHSIMLELQRLQQNEQQ